MGKESQIHEHPRKRGRIEKLVKSVRTAVAIEGGLLNTLRTVLEVLRSDGPRGLHRRATGALVKHGRNDYEEWIRRYDTLDDTHRDQIQKRIAQMPYKPLISIVMPTFNTPTHWLEEALNSVRGQLYENWELCIADDASSEPAVRCVLETASEADKRIKVLFRAKTGHISAASNSALEICAGDWIALMDHDDLLPEHALFWVANEINKSPNAKLIYSDEDKISENGYRFEPYFKCDFNRDLFYSHNMISHLGVYKTELIEHIGGFREGFEGSQDYDLALRAIERLSPNEIVHIPRVLYHWRKHSSSTASGVSVKPYAQESARKAIREHLERSGIVASVTTDNFGHHVKYAIPSSQPWVTVIVLAGKNTRKLIKFLQLLNRQAGYHNFRVCVIASEPTEISYSDFEFGKRPIPQIDVVQHDSMTNKMAIINSIITESESEYIALIDTVAEQISANWLAELVSLASQPGIGAVGAKLLNSNGTIHHAGYVLGIGGFVGNAFEMQDSNASCYFGRAMLISSFSATSSACMAVKKSLFHQVGGFDDNNYSFAFSDIDFCLKLREIGYRNVLNPHVVVTHSRWPNLPSSDSLDHKTQMIHFECLQERWGDSLRVDFNYSPNLTLEFEDFSFAWPPRVEKL